MLFCHNINQNRNSSSLLLCVRSAGDVLQDIGCMLSDLTQELDNMLNMEDIERCDR